MGRRGASAAYGALRARRTGRAAPSAPRVCGLVGRPVPERRDTPRSGRAAPGPGTRAVQEPG
ncbi:hypothetical protein ScoT_15640 [Streptomyces albidoflavus]|uniref:Uncharacterized protein n=1 Tax=Streptomyces albidoflavus TaxID=1886 RepID=A0AA37BV32_9ACTN|nr:hypothetical protein ScoT_15640 [Streptomyces albidoflavus]